MIMTRQEAIDWVNSHDDNSDLDRDELDAAFEALLGRPADDDESVCDRWTNCVMFAEDDDEGGTLSPGR